MRTSLGSGEHKGALKMSKLIDYLLREEPLWIAQHFNSVSFATRDDSTELFFT